MPNSRKWDRISRSSVGSFYIYFNPLVSVPASNYKSKTITDYISFFLISSRIQMESKTLGIHLGVIISLQFKVDGKNSCRLPLFCKSHTQRVKNLQKFIDWNQWTKEKFKCFIWYLHFSDILCLHFLRKSRGRRKKNTFFLKKSRPCIIKFDLQ